MAWLMTQSPIHKAMTIDAIEWLCMPALLKRQFYIFRDGEKPVGLALWARCSPEAEKKLENGLIEPENRLSLEEWDGGPNVWLVDLIAPFATNQNRQREIMIADLISGPLKETEFRFHRTDPVTGKREVQTIEADAGEKLKAAVEAAVATKQ
ncbi:toxin-activating lysine-acyltransferase [Erythrobacter sp. EC-HK427]|uniref:toxin-activating lysine-acyltransferase n=1 Tax=Erythrobacter sp. EC-HK427 TaxID=2038396 RepID=UPI00125F5F79|nr:toxin-activating lysine-acyltransferase [Erythrobacter sp. EC-HK427]